MTKKCKHILHAGELQDRGVIFPLAGAAARGESRRGGSVSDWHPSYLLST